MANILDDHVEIEMQHITSSQSRSLRLWTTPIRRFFMRKADRAVTLLLVVQALTIFIMIPVSANGFYNRRLLDISHVAFAIIAATLLIRHHTLRFTLFLSLAVLLALPFAFGLLGNNDGNPVPSGAITSVAFLFNALITIMVVRHVFGPGRVTTNRIEGAILVYLNVSALFSIAFAFVTAFEPTAIVFSDGRTLPTLLSARVATLSYFSLTTITTTGFGDLVPTQPLARSLANLESVFGHLFPATMLARLVALTVTHARKR